MTSHRNPSSPQHISTAPFSMRLTPEERAFLAANCGDRSWAAYIRSCVFGERSNSLRQRQPKIDDKELVAVLAGLGRSRLSSNLNQLAKSANSGSLQVSEDLEEQLRDAAIAVIAMRHALIAALGIKPEGESTSAPKLGTK